MTSTRAPFFASIIAAPRPGLLFGKFSGRISARDALDEHQRFPLPPGMVAERDDVGAGIDELVIDRLGNAEAAGGVLAVDDRPDRASSRAWRRASAR